MSVEVHEAAGVLFVTLDAPQNRNALSGPIVEAIAGAVARVNSETALRCLVLRGRGGVFSAGGDFANFQAMIAAPKPASGPDPIATNNRAFGRLLTAITGCAVPSLAVVDGPAFGGGCGLAAACDVVLASPRAVFATPELTLGLPPAQIAPFLQARLGPTGALRLLTAGERLNAEAAKALGLADIVAEDVAAAALALVNGWLRAEPAALRATKAILAAARGDKTAALDMASEAFAASLRSGTASAGIAAFQSKSATPWTQTLSEWPA